MASDRSKKILAAGKVATFNGWTLGVLGGLSILLGLFSLTGLIVGVALVIVAWNEFRGRALIRQWDPRGAMLLAGNQVGLMGIVIAYSVWSMYTAIANPSSQAVELEELAGLPSGLVTDLTLMVYGVVIVLTLLVQGLTARYYFVRVQQLKDYLEQTPKWIVDMQRKTMNR
ncbi:MAG: hypothetical protein BMS9Abin29_0728 [Gemmatimonadota bacterium]|nr:MAG: hypothetical protein BMS9Abin29_0728 [Gemmatimonadota bacterium]